MKNNLEGIPFNEVVDIRGISYTSFREKLPPIYPKVYFDIIKGYIFLLLFSFLIIYGSSELSHNWWWIIIPVGSLLIGYTAAYLALYIHEAGHFNIHPNKKINDRLATIALCLPLGLSIKSYRKIHWHHHIYLGTPEDTEVSYFNGLTWLFILETLTGIHLVRVMLKKKDNPILSKDLRKRSNLMLASGVLFHLSIILPAVFFKSWAFVICWIAGFGLFFPFFATIRQILEHRDENASHLTDFTHKAHGKISRLFIQHFLNSSFGSAGFTRHMIHHWDPQVSYTRLKDVEYFLGSCKRTSQIISDSKTSYRSVFKKLLKAP